MAPKIWHRKMLKEGKGNKMPLYGIYMDLQQKYFVWTHILLDSEFNRWDCFLKKMFI